MVKSFQGLRVIGMLIIFLYHGGLFFDGHLAVPLFFMISGFVIYYNYKETLNKINIKNSFHFAFKKFKRFYGVHIFCFLLTVILLNKTASVLGTFLNLTLLQSFSFRNIDFFSYNSSSWYLSSMLFCYLISSIIIKIINKIRYENKYLIYNILFLYGIKGLFYFLFKDIGVISYWLLYISPFLRVIDFSIGMSLCAMFINNKNLNERKDTTRLEMASIGILILGFIGALFLPEMARMCFYYMPFIALILYVFSLENGKISKFLSGKIFLKISSISFEFYMVQEIFLKFFRRILSGLPIFLCKGLQISLGFLVSLIAAYLINKYISGFRLKEKKERVLKA